MRATRDRTTPIKIPLRMLVCDPCAHKYGLPDFYPGDTLGNLIQKTEMLNQCTIDRLTCIMTWVEVGTSEFQAMWKQFKQVNNANPRHH